MLKQLLSSPQWIYLLRIALAALCGGAIGLERSRRQKEAGVRTHVLVALGAALVMVVSKYGFMDFGTQVDVSRLASNVVTGVSFLGAGIIFLKGDSIKGLTTAAGVWATAGVGLAVGAGLYLVGFCTAGLILLLQVLLHRNLRRIEGEAVCNLTVLLRPESDPAALRRWLAEKKCLIGGCNARRAEDGGILLQLLIKSEHGMDLEAVARLMRENPDVSSVTQ